MKKIKFKITLLLNLIFFNCTGWPLLQHAITASLEKDKQNQNPIYALLMLKPNSTTSSTSSGSGTTDTTPTNTKDMLTFGIQSPSATGTISGTNISVTVAGATNLKTLIANFTHNGASVKIGAATQTSGVTSNNFSYTVTYTVYAQDGSSQNYTVNVIATSCTSAAFCYLFAYAPSPPGGGANFGSFTGASGDGIAGIDSDCVAGAISVGLPSSNYRAVLMTTGGTTIRNQTTNWVLKPNKQYRRQNGVTVIGTTNSSSVFSVSTGTLTNSVVGAFTNVFSGITVSSDTSWTPNSNNCSNWTSAAAVVAQGANGNFANTLAFDAGTSQNCNTGVAVYCAEQ